MWYITGVVTTLLFFWFLNETDSLYKADSLLEVFACAIVFPAMWIGVIFILLSSRSERR